MELLKTETVGSCKCECNEKRERLIIFIAVLSQCDKIIAITYRIPTRTMHIYKNPSFRTSSVIVNVCQQ